MAFDSHSNVISLKYLQVATITQQGIRPLGREEKTDWNSTFLAEPYYFSVSYGTTGVFFYPAGVKNIYRPLMMLV